MSLINNRRVLSFAVLAIAVVAVILSWIWPGRQGQLVTYIIPLLTGILIFLLGLLFRSGTYSSPRPWKIPAARSRGSLWDVVKGFICWISSILSAICAALAVRFGIIPDSAIAVVPAMLPALTLFIVGTYFVGAGIFKWLLGSNS